MLCVHEYTVSVTRFAWEVKRWAFVAARAPRRRSRLTDARAIRPRSTARRRTLFGPRPTPVREWNSQVSYGMNMPEPFETYRARLASTLRFLFGERIDHNQQNLQRGFPPFMLREILAAGPIDASIPYEHGGRGADAAEILAVLETASYESLPLSLILGISGALFAEPMAKYADPSVAAPVFQRMRGEGALGGLMITEPGFGTDALGMQTSFAHDGNGGPIRIEGEKHWAGLSGWADYWLVTARRRMPDGSLGRDLGFFFCDSRQPDQLVRVEEYYHNLGLYMIPYGRNRLDLTLPANHKLEFAGGGIRLMQDLLHRSRMRFPGMALGFIRRNLDEAIAHTRERLVGGSPLVTFDQVQRRIAQLQAWFTTASAFCRDAARRSGIGLNLVKEGLAANIHKALMSDYMQFAAQSLLQLVGAAGYRQDSYAGRATTDSRPFQIFEGSNDVIYQQIADGFLGPMKQQGEISLLSFLTGHPFTQNATAYVKKLLDFSITTALPQRRKIDLGQILARVTAIEWNLGLRSGGFDRSMVDGAIAQLTEEIAGLAGVFFGGHTVAASATPSEASSWTTTL